MPKKEPVELLLKGFKTAVNASKTLINKIISAIKAIFKALKNPKQLGKDIIKFLEDLFGLGKKVGDELDAIIDSVLNGKVKLKDNKLKGNFGEIVAHKIVTTLKTINGKPVKYEPLHKIVNSLDQKITKGLDALYINTLFKPPPPPYKYLINEAKFNTATLNRTITKSRGSQMQKKWIEYNLDLMIKDQDLLFDILNTGYDPVLTKISKDGSLKSMKLLDDKAKILKEFK